MMRYPEYKNSQLGWVGEIPNHWEVIKFHYLSQESRRKNDDDVEREMLSLSSYTGVQVKQYEYENTKRSKEESLTYLVVEPNQLVVNPMWQIQRGIGVSYLHGIVSPGYRVYYIDLERLIPQYLHYLMRSDGYVDEYNKHIRGLTTYDRSVKKEDFEDIGVLLPPKQEQTQIANFLNRKTGQIDELIRIKERRIELLQEQRTALINQAVTKGLDPNVEMKPSGVEWIGEIPAHWAIIKLRYLGILQNGISKDSDSFGLGYPFLSYGDVYNNETLPTQVEGLVKSTKADRERYSVKETDVFFTRTSETIEEIGISSTCMKTIENCAFSGFLIRFRNTSTVLTKEFSKYYFTSHLPRIFLAREVNIVTRSSLSQELLKRLLVLLPPPDGQKEIAIFLDEQTQKIDSMIEKENKQIQLLREYRQSLISEAVTGKIDVRSEV